MRRTIPLTHAPKDTKLLADNLQRVLLEQGLISEPKHWLRLSGGRTNTLWRLDGSGQALVCKLYDPRRDNPLFPNDAAAEAATLGALSAHDIAPRLRGHVRTPEGDCLVYEHLEGPLWSAGHEDVARVLRTLHACPAPGNLREIPTGSQGILAHGEQILDLCAPETKSRFLDSKPAPTTTAPVSKTLIHGDVVPSNLVRSATGLRLIDWQCPAWADPCEDLAIFLSPAMQTLYGGAPFSDGEIDLFLKAYGVAEVSERYATLAPSFHWRMAAYCQWKFERGEADYADAIQLELASIAKVS